MNSSKRAGCAKPKDQKPKTTFPTASEEIFVEIQLPHFTNLLQVDTYNTLHTLAAFSKAVTQQQLS
jgi:hypothetical protein